MHERSGSPSHYPIRDLRIRVAIGMQKATAVPSRAIPTYPSRREFKEVIKAGKKPSIGLFLNAGSPLIAERLAASGHYDWLLVDAQHSPIGPTQLQNMLTAISVHGCPSLVRVGGPDDRIGIQTAVDMGAYGIMIPTVRTADDARKLVQSALFPPRGSRSIAFPIRPQLGREVGEFLSAANDEVLLIIQIETAECLENLDAILSVPGLDAAFVGPFDLCFALGLFERHGYPGGLVSEDLRGENQKIIRACRAAGVAAGSFARGLDDTENLLQDGFTLLAPGTDVSLLERALGDEAQGFNRLRQRFDK